MVVPLTGLRVYTVCVMLIRSTVNFFFSSLQYLYTGNWAAVLQLLFDVLQGSAASGSAKLYISLLFPPLRVYVAVRGKPAIRFHA